VGDPSALPVRPAGTRTRAGNAMARTRAAALEGALRCLEKQGSRKTTMADIAALGGIAKATLYNHFRTKEDVFAAVIDDQVSRLGADCLIAVSEGLTAALSLAADRIALHPALRRIAAEEPPVLAALACPADHGAWSRARAGVSATLAAAGCDGQGAATDVVLRWLASHVLDPGTSAGRRAGAGLLVRALVSGGRQEFATG
jgi:AcrR family transcriptional regulator